MLSVCPDPGQLVWTSVWQSISKGDYVRWSLQTCEVGAYKGSFFSLTIWVFLWESISDFRWIWRCGIQREWWPDVLEDNSNLKPHQPGSGQKIGQAAWLCGSHPLGCMITYLEKFLLFLNLSMLSLIGRRLLIPTVSDIHSIHSSEMSGRSCVGRVARRSCWTQCIRL